MRRSDYEVHWQTARVTTILYFLATEETEQQNIKRFSVSLASFAHQEFIAKANFNDWIELFRIFAGISSENTKILVIDEFQYLVNAKPAFPSIFQKAWDEILSKKTSWLSFEVLISI